MARIAMLLCACAVLGTAGAAGAATCDRLDTASWLLGEWLAQDAGKDITESWRADDSIIESESLRLVRMAEEVFYVAKVAHNPYPVSFRLVDCPEGRLVFENPLHDFPRKLEYTLLDAGTMTVAVTDGAGKGFTLHFRRQGDSRP